MFEEQQIYPKMYGHSKEAKWIQIWDFLMSQYQGKNEFLW